MSQKQRKHPRKEDRLLVQLLGKDFHIYTNVTNFGLGGAFVNTLYLLNEGTQVDLRLQLPNVERPLDIRSKVVRQVADGPEKENMDNIGMGLEFTDMSEESKTLIEEAVATTMVAATTPASAPRPTA